MRKLIYLLCFLSIIATYGCKKEKNNPEPVVEASSPEYEISGLTQLFSDGYHAKWSPDGSMVVYTVRTSTAVSLWIYETETTESYPIVEGIDGDFTTSWSPDSKKIAFDAYESETSQRMQIWIKNLDTGELSMFTNNSGSSVPSWSNDGSRIAFPSNNSIQIKNVNTGISTTIPNTTGASCPHWKYDDSQIVFTIGPESVNDIYIINLDGTGRTKLTNFSGRDDRPQWSPDGRSVVYEVFDSTPKIYIYSVESGNSHLLIDENSSGFPCWSPNGDKIIFSTRNGVYTANIQSIN